MIQKTLNALLISFFSVLFLNCQSQQVYFVDKISPFPTKVSKSNYYFIGLSGSELIDVRKICKEKRVGMLSAKTTAFDAFLSVITIGVYTPRHYYIYCVE